MHYGERELKKYPTIQQDQHDMESSINFRSAHASHSIWEVPFHESQDDPAFSALPQDDDGLST